MAPTDWLPTVLIELGFSTAHAHAATTHLVRNLLKPTDERLRGALAAPDKWHPLMAKLSAFITSLPGEGERDGDELTTELSSLVREGLSRVQVDTDGGGGGGAETPHAGDDRAPAPEPSPDAAADAETKEKKARLLRTALEWAEKTAGGDWRGEVVDVDGGSRVGRIYAANRKTRGEKQKEEEASIFELASDEEHTARGVYELSAAEKRADARAAPWAPQPYGGKELVALSAELRAEVAFRCPCNPTRVVKIGSLGTHRAGKMCREYFATAASLKTATTNAASRMRDPAVMATDARVSGSPALNIPPAAAAGIAAAFAHARATVSAMGSCSPTAPPTASPLASGMRTINKALSGAKKRKQAKVKARVKQPS